MGGGHVCGSSKTGLRRSDTSPPMPIWRMWAYSWPLGAITQRRHGPRCRAADVSACSLSSDSDKVWRHGSEAGFPKTMALALLKLPLSVLALLVLGLPALVAVVGLLLVRSRVPHPRLQPHHDVAGYIYSGLAVLYAVLLAFVVIIVWEQFNTTDIRVHKEADERSNLFRAAQVFPTPVQQAILDAVRSYARAVIEEEWSAMAREIE